MIIVNDMPVASFSYAINGSTVAFNNESQDGELFEWDFGDNNKSNEMNPQNTYSNDGEFEVTLVVHNGLCNDTLTQSVIIGQSSVSEELSEKLTVFPNPARELINIQNLPDLKFNEIGIVDVLGKYSLLAMKFEVMVL